MNQEGRVTTERHGHVLLIGMDRAAKRNAFDRAMLSALALAYGELEHDDDLRCGVLFAHGDHFTAGLELTQFASSLGQDIQELAEGAIDPLGIQGPRLSKPMLCAVQGICLTIGSQLPHASRQGLVSVLHRNSAYRCRRAALASSHDTSGRIDKTPVLIQSCRTSSVLSAILRAPTKSA
jgi:Enoyl-CoA hydratase/isomerase